MYVIVREEKTTVKIPQCSEQQIPVLLYFIGYLSILYAEICDLHVYQSYLQDERIIAKPQSA